MSKLLTVVILILSQLILAAEPAEQALVEKFRTAFADHCAQLENSGVKNIGGISIAEMKERSAQINVRIRPVVQVEKDSELAAVRRSAVWDPAAKTIWISAAHASRTNPESIREIAAHEYYRAVGIADENFEASALTNSYILFQKISEDHPSLIARPKSLDVIRKKIQNLNARSGISGVGGGGDIRSQQVKEAIFQEFFFDFDRGLMTETQFEVILNLWADLKIELSPRVSAGSYFFDSATNVYLIPTEGLSGNSDENNFTKIVLPITQQLIYKSAAIK